MRFSVRVPVLSEQMTVTEPSVSTAGSLRIRACRFSIRCAPSASAMVTTAGRPSGTTATAMLMAVMNISSQSSPSATPTTKMTTTSAAATIARLRPNWFRRRCSGVCVVLDALDQLGHVPELGAHPGGHHRHLPAAVGDRGAHEGHVDLVAQRGRRAAGRREGRRGLLHRLRLPGQDRFLDAQIGGLDQASIRGHQVAGLQQHDVSRDKVMRRHLSHLACAPDAHQGHRQLFQSGHRLLGAILLDEAEDRVEHDDREDRDGIFDIADQRRDDRGDDQDQHQRAGELLQDDAPRRSAAALHKLIRSVAAQPSNGLVGAQSLVGRNFQACGRFGWLQQIPGSLYMRGSFRQIGFHGRHSFLDL